MAAQEAVVQLRPLSSAASALAQPLGALLLIRVLVEEGLKALAADLDLDVALDLGLTAQARGRAHVERLVEDVELLVFDFRQLVEALGHVDVAGGAGAHPAAAIALGCADTLGRGQDGLARVYRDLELFAREAYDWH